jgi:hypothetical protein
MNSARNQYFIPKSLTILLICVVVFSACTSHFSQNKIKQGVVSFDITYINTSGRNIPIQLLPKTMLLKFNSRYASYTLEDRLGLFSISNIVDLKKCSHLTLIKVFDKKYAYRGTRKETSILFSSASVYDIKPTTDTLRIAGFLCKKSVVSDTLNHKVFNIYSTLYTVLDTPNVNTPYEHVDGMLLDFLLKLKNIDMKLLAKKIEEKNIVDTEFGIPSDYKLITKKQMEDIIISLLP